jgi:uncharacterized protein (TIGR00730 family)
MNGFNSICVFCGSSARVADVYKTAARDLGTIMGQNAIRLIYGGGHVGLMGIVADATMAAGGQVTGIIPDFLEKIEVGHHHISELIVTDSMHDRKAGMYTRADAFVTLPGGLGSLDETFEVLTWTQLGLSNKPVILVDVDGYWQPFLALVDHVISAGFARPENRDMIHVVKQVSDVLPLLQRLPARPEAGDDSADRL